MPNVETPGEEQSDSSIVDQIEELINDYIVFPQEFYTFPIALWVLATYYYLLFESFGYLEFCAAHGGIAKTVLFEILRLITKDGQIDENITLSAMLTDIEAIHPTKMIDQAEKLIKRDNDNLRSAILSGTRREAMISVRSGKGTIRRSPYCPKVFALVGRELGGTLNDRCCIIVWMQPATPRVSHNETPFKERAKEIGNACAVTTGKHEPEITAAIQKYRNIDFLNGRENEIWKPVVVVCEVFCPKRRLELEQAIAYIKGTKRLERKPISLEEAYRLQAEAEDRLQLVRDMISLIGDGYGMLSGEMLPALLAMPCRIWGFYAETGLTKEKMEALLKPMKIAPRQSRHFTPDKRPRRGYVRSDVEAALATPQKGGTPVQVLSNKGGGDA